MSEEHAGKPHPGQFPMWALAHAERFEEAGFPDALERLTNLATGERSLALFTLEGRAEDFAARQGLSGLVGVRIESRASLLEWLPMCPGQGIANVDTDPGFDDGNWTGPVTGLLAYYRATGP